METLAQKIARIQATESRFYEEVPSEHHQKGCNCKQCDPPKAKAKKKVKGKPRSKSTKGKR